MAAAVLPIALEVLIAQEVINNLVGQLVSQTLSAALAPEFALLQQESWKFAFSQTQGNIVGLPLSPEALADAVVRGHRDFARAEDDANRSGLGDQDFQTLVDATGEPLPLQALTEAWRRKIIEQAGGGANSTSLEQGIRESRVKDKWIKVIEALQFRLADPGVLIEGWLRSVIDPQTAKAELYKNGIDDATATLMFKAAGRPPGPQELITLMLRGIIPETGRGADVLSLEQGFLETDLKDKWWPAWKELAVYLPPPRTITALLRAGSISEKTARDLFHKHGLPAELVDAYVADASHQRTQAVKELAVGTVVNMYKAKELDRKQAHDFIVARHYSEEDANFLLDYADFQLVEAQVSALVTRLRTFYVGHKINKQTAVDALTNVGLTPAAIGHLLAVWDQEAHASPVLLTTTQLANAAAKGWIDPLAAYDEIQGRGYDARDAWVLLAEHKTDMSGVPKPAGVI